MEDRKLVQEELYDVIGIGLGPFNLGLAALLDGVEGVNSLFLETKSAFDWHKGMLIEGTTLQVPFLADLVTMADPTSPYSFLNYLKEQGRLYSFYFFEHFHIPRKEYNHYCQWAADQLVNCGFGKRVVDVTCVRVDGSSIYEVAVQDVSNGTTARYLTRKLVLGVGTAPYVSEELQGELSETLFHSASYMERSVQCRQASSITVVGSGQSAAEIFYDLLKSQPEHDYELTWMTRSRGFFPMEYSKLGLEHFSPDYSSYFYNLPPSKKDDVLRRQDLLYKGISAATIAQIYDELYHRTACGEQAKAALLPLTEVTEIRSVEPDLRSAGGNIGVVTRKIGSAKYTLSCKQWEQEQTFRHESEIVILATGYKQKNPDFLDGIRHLIRWDEQGRYEVEENYSLRMTEGSELAGSVYVQNGELHTHGIGAPDLGLGAHRNATIINSLLGETKYAVRSRNVFQQFGVK